MRTTFKIILVAILMFICGVLVGMNHTYENETVVFCNCGTVEEKTDDILPPEKLYVGKCKITAYCAENYPHICNDGDSSKTATGTTPTAGRTCAVDPKVIPYGSEVIINGHTYIAEDCGGAVKGNRIDILFATHQEALNFGVQYADVSYVTKES